MLIEEKEIDFLSQKNPKSKLIGKFEIAIPYYNTKSDVYYFKNEKLPPIEDAFLRLYNLYFTNDLKLSIFEELLGLEDSEILNAFYNLIDLDYVDSLNKNVTDEGRKYIRCVLQDKSTVNCN